MFSATFLLATGISTLLKPIVTGYLEVIKQFVSKTFKAFLLTETEKVRLRQGGEKKHDLILDGWTITTKFTSYILKLVHP